MNPPATISKSITYLIILSFISISSLRAADVPEPLSTLTVPEPSNLKKFVKSKRWAIRLGKALFWDMQVGSDGAQACATCHFSAFADNRIKNQLNPGGAHSGDTLFGFRDDGGPVFCDRTLEDTGPNQTLTANDFPLRRGFGQSQCDTEDVVSSQGVVGSHFLAIANTGDVDIASDGINGDGADPDGFVHPVAGTLVRRVEPRNTPTVINAVFFKRQFWDGRAMPNFNGKDTNGSVDVNGTDPNPFVVKKVKGPYGGSLQSLEVSIDNGGLASQAVGPPLSLFEMSANHRRFADLGLKMYPKHPLAKQKVHKKDSVLGKMAKSKGKKPGLKGKYTYEYLVKKAFKKKWWAGHKKQRICIAKVGNTVVPQVAISTAAGHCPDGVNYDKFTQKEYNFSLFWGLAIQLYEATLRSGNTPFDACAAEADPFACLGSQNPDWENGLRVFMNDPLAPPLPPGPGAGATATGNCITCHRGPMFSGATTNEFITLGTFGEIPTIPGTVGIYDLGFANVGQSDTPWDLGIGGTFSDGTALSFSRHAKDGNTMLGSIPVGDVVCDDNAPPGCATTHGPADFDLVMSPGGFKTPGLRNRMWMGPHFHNGDAADLDGVLGFYNANGNNNVTKDSRLEDINIGFSTAPGTPRAVLASFLEEALADPDVEFQKAPFDHPALCVPHGHDDTTGDTIFRHVEAVGKKGSSKPLVTFNEMLAQDSVVLASKANSLQDPCPEYMLPVDETGL